MKIQQRIPYVHELTDREDLKKARRALFSLLHHRFGELNSEGMSFSEWRDAANFGCRLWHRLVGGHVALLAWARCEDPTEWAAMANDPCRPGEYLHPQHEEGTDCGKRPQGWGYILGIKDGEPVTYDAFRTEKEARRDYDVNIRRRTVDFHLPLPKLRRNNV